MPRDFGFRVPKDKQYGELYDFNYIPRSNFNLVKPIVEEKKQDLEEDTKNDNFENPRDSIP